MGSVCERVTWCVSAARCFSRHTENIWQLSAGSITDRPDSISNQRRRTKIFIQFRGFQRASKCNVFNLSRRNQLTDVCECAARSKGFTANRFQHRSKSLVFTIHHCVSDIFAKDSAFLPSCTPRILCENAQSKSKATGPALGSQRASSTLIGGDSQAFNVFRVIQGRAETFQTRSEMFSAYRHVSQT